MIFKFSLLGCYFLKTRLTSLGNRIAFIVLYIIPISYLTSYFITFSYSALFDMLLLMMCTYSVYEGGYIYNDTITIKKETQPTLRLTDREIEYFSRNLCLILSVRILTLIVLISTLYTNTGQVVYYTSLSFLIVLASLYALYNHLRSRINLILHFGLVSLRYIIPLIPIIIYSDLSLAYIFMSTLFIYPILNTFERSFEDRFNLWSGIKINRHKFRILYYSVLSLIYLMCFLMIETKLFPFMIIFIVLLISRTVAYYIDRRTI